MSTTFPGSAVHAVALADFRDRARRPAFLVTVLAAVVLGYLAVPPDTAEYGMVKVGDYRGAYTPAYAGAMVALVGSVWLPFFGFYVTKTSIGRDLSSGVGQLLAGTPLRTSGYLLGKFASNLAVLLAMTGALAVTVPAMQFLRGESQAVDLFAWWWPFLVLCAPVLCMAAGAAVLFDSVRALRGGLGNIAWFFVYPALYFALPAHGFDAVTAGLQHDLAAQHPGAAGGVSVGLTTQHALHTFTYSGLGTDGSLAAHQLIYVVTGLALALLPALWFARFDPERTLERPPAARPEPAERLPEAAGAFAQHPRALTPVTPGPPFMQLALGGLRLHLKGQSRWWWTGVAALTVAGLAAPSNATPMVLLFAWLWPVLLWARLGVHALEHGVDELTSSAPAFRSRLLAEWLGGVLIAAMTGAGPLVRMALDGDGPGVAAWLGGALFLPALALFLGELTRSGRWFQVLYLGVWYFIANNLPAVDFMGALRDGDTLAGPSPALWASLAAALLGGTLAVQEARHAHR